MGLIISLMSKRFWAMLANGSRARLFELDLAAQRTHEIADFIHPRGRLHPVQMDATRGGHTQRGTPDGGLGGSSFQPRTDSRHKERSIFARELADYLDAALAARRFDALLLAASHPLLGELRAHLSGPVRAALGATEATDWVALPALALTERLLAMAHPGSELHGIARA